MPTYEFEFRFRELHEDEGRGSLGARCSSSGRALRVAVDRLVDDMTARHPDAVFDRLTFYGHPD